MKGIGDWVGLPFSMNLTLDVLVTEVVGWGTVSWFLWARPGVTSSLGKQAAEVRTGCNWNNGGPCEYSRERGVRSFGRHRSDEEEEEEEEEDNLTHMASER